MRTDRQRQASRANGAKSRGPATAPGKLASSLNAATHGMLSGTIVLKRESQERFRALVAALHEELQPRTPIETSLVENMAVARWRQMRVWGMEKAGLEHEMRRQDEASGPETGAPDTATRSALAFRALSDGSRSLELINRYESRYDRQYLRAHRRFLELVDRRTPPAAEPPQSVVERPAPAPPVTPAPPPATQAPLPSAEENTVSAERTRRAPKGLCAHRHAGVTYRRVAYPGAVYRDNAMRDNFDSRVTGQKGPGPLRPARGNKRSYR
jgi:hypothetical protein